MSAIKEHLEHVGNIAVEHWHYYGAHAPTPLAFDDFDEFINYLRGKVKAGDAIDVYPFPCRTTEAIARGKYPDQTGKVPAGGAY